MYESYLMIVKWVIDRKIMSGDTHDISTIYSSPSTTFHCTYLYYSTMMPTIISEYLWVSPSTTLTFPLPFLFFFSLFFYLPFQHLHQTDSKMDFNYDLLLYVYFYLHFYLHFLCYRVSPFISGVLVFIFTYSHRLPPSRFSSFSLRILC